MMQSEQINDLVAALVAAQGKIEPPAKSAHNPFYKSRYAPLDVVWDACRGPLGANGLAVIQTTTVRDGLTVLVTTLAHTSGQWIRGEYPITAVKQDPQGIGSAITYARRYALAAITSTTPRDEDDDAETAQGRGATNGPKPLQAPKRVAAPAATTTSEPADDSAAALRTPPADEAGSEFFSDHETLPGDDPFDEPGPPEDTRFLNEREIKSLFGALAKSRRSPAELKGFVSEKWGLGSRKDLRLGHLPEVLAWMQGEKRGEST
jgi:hypothetical protein